MTRPLALGDPDQFRVARDVDVLIPTRDRPAELAVTLAGLAAQQDVAFGVVVSDQSDGDAGWAHPAAAAMVRVLRHSGRKVLLARHLPRRGLAEHRDFLLSHSRARNVLCLDDDVWLEPGAVARMVAAIRKLRCGFVGNAVHGLSYYEDVRPETHLRYEPWAGAPVPERVQPGTEAWGRVHMHSAANLLHITEGLGLGPAEWRAYKVSWVGGCVLYDRERLLDCGGFGFWRCLPPDHQGEDVAAQVAVMRRHGGAGIVPSGAYHLESPTTVTERGKEAWEMLFPDRATAEDRGEVS
jgi:GT2 family glycosyltransferase